jgi:RNA polymerase sigma factor FliA
VPPSPSAPAARAAVPCSSASPAELMSMVEGMARRLARRLPSQVDRDDLVGAGLLGLATALGRFNPDRSVSLTAFAEHRVRGEMLDELRRMDALSRDARGAVKRRQRVIDTRRTQGLDDDAGEIAKQMGVSLPALRAIERQAAQDGAVPLEGLGRELPASQPDPFEEVSRRELASRLAAALDRLPRTQRLVMRLRYLEDQSLREIGDLLGVTPSRVCQVHGEALRALRAHLADEAMALAA